MDKINSKISELKEKLPFGSKKEIASRTNVSTKTVSKVLNGEKCSLEVHHKVIKCAKDILSEYNNI